MYERERVPFLFLLWYYGIGQPLSVLGLSEDLTVGIRRNLAQKFCSDETENLTVGIFVLFTATEVMRRAK